MTVVGLRALGRALRRTPVRPRSVAALLAHPGAAVAFRHIVRQVFPGAAAEIWEAQAAAGTRENARVAAFVRRVEAEFFPLYECDEYDQVVWGIPFIRFGWSYDAFHDLERRTGELLLLALCQAPVDVHIPLLEWAETYVPRGVLERVPAGGFSPAALHAQFDETSCVAVADFTDWLWGNTGTVFLDVNDEVEVIDAEWTQENVADLAAQWQRARAILDRIDTLAAWLEADPATHFAQLLEAARGNDARLVYERTRRLYVAEITAVGLVTVQPDGSDELPVPMGVPA